MKKLLIIATVLAAVAVVLWLKSKQTHVSPGDPPVAERAGVAGQGGPTVLLFADLREADESGGCGDIISMVRDLYGAPSLQVAEFDSRKSGEAARRYSVHSSPSVIILDTDGKEQARFEGEAPATIVTLRSALDALHPSSTSPGERATP